MRLALLIALSADRRTAMVLSDTVPADQAIKAVKQMIETGEAPDARYPIVAAVALDHVLREHRFKPTAEEIAKAVEAGDFGACLVQGEDELNALLAENGRLAEQLKDAQKTLQSLSEECAERLKSKDHEVAKLKDALAKKAQPVSPDTGSKHSPTNKTGGESAAGAAVGTNAPAASQSPASHPPASTAPPGKTG